MDNAVTFFVPGKPATQGSKVSGINPRTKRVFTKDSCEGLKDWRAKVSAYAMQHAQEVWTDAVYAEFEFHLCRPKGHYRSGKNAHLLKDSAPPRHKQSPDTLKMARAVEDAMTGIVYADDSQIDDSRYRKKWVGRDETPGVKVTVTPIAPAGGRE